MATMIADTQRDKRPTRGREARWLFAVAFIYFLVVATVMRLIPRAFRPDLTHAHEGKSIFGEASEAATSVVGFAYMR